MSRYAYLLCVDDREYVWLGKIVTDSDGSASVSAVPAGEVDANVRSFLASHLEHELRTVAEDTPGYALLDGGHEVGANSA